MAKIIIEMPLKNFVFQLPFQQTAIVKTQCHQIQANWQEPKMNKFFMPISPPTNAKFYTC
jgi:hypothetical protein